MQTRTVRFVAPYDGPNQFTVRTMPEYSYNESPGHDMWEEYAIGDCGLGCKIYRSLIDGNRFILMHNSNYGCRR